MAFSHSGGTLATCAPDGQCLLWKPLTPADAAKGGCKPQHMPPPTPAAPPAFTLFKVMGGGKSKGRKKNDVGPQWRCVAMPSEPPRSTRAENRDRSGRNEPS